MTDRIKYRLNGQRVSRRTFLQGTVATAAVPLVYVNHAWSQDVTYAGEVFDAGGATLPIAEWGGFWEENVRKLLLDDFEKEFNCKIQYDTSWPWFPKFVAGGAQNPPVAICNWNLPEMFKTARAGDFFMPQEEILANVPNANGVWPFALANGVGITWAFGRYCYAYRTDLVDPAPEGFKSFWEDRFADRRATYITSNTLFMAFFLMASKIYGSGEGDIEAGYEAMRAAMPMKISDFTGNMQTLLERGEINIGVQVDGEVYMQMDNGVSVAPMLWEEVRPILTQTKTISRYADPMQKRLALALLNRTLDPEFITRFDEVFYLRPTHRDAAVPPNLADKGVVNSADATDGLEIPNWELWLENEDDIVETVNEIFAG